MKHEVINASIGGQWSRTHNIVEAPVSIQRRSDVGRSSSNPGSSSSTNSSTSSTSSGSDRQDGVSSIGRRTSSTLMPIVDLAASGSDAAPSTKTNTPSSNLASIISSNSTTQSLAATDSPHGSENSVSSTVVAASKSRTPQLLLATNASKTSSTRAVSNALTTPSVSGTPVNFANSSTTSYPNATQTTSFPCYTAENFYACVDYMSYYYTDPQLYSICTSQEDHFTQTYVSTLTTETYTDPVVSGGSTISTSFFTTVYPSPVEFEATPPCCSGCTIRANNVQLYYWPTPAPSNAPTSVNIDGTPL